MSIATQINKRIFELMEQRNVSGYKLMKDLKVPQGTISQARHDKASFTITQLVSIAEYFNVSLDWLATGKTSGENIEKGNDKLLEENIKLKEELKKIDTEVLVLDKIKDLVYTTKRKK